MRILITSDLHLVPRWRTIVLNRLEKLISINQPEALVIAGDLAVAREADSALAAVRQVFPIGPILLSLGNHDFWLGAERTHGLLSDVLERWWQAPAVEYEVTLLDQESGFLGEIAIVGGYGHYDLGFAHESLVYDGEPVTREHYLTGVPPVATPLRWRDFDRLPISLDLEQAAQTEVRNVSRRLAQTNGDPVLVVLHTPPFEELLGVPPPALSGDPSIFAFFRAYLGNRAMGEEIRGYQQKLVGVVCGHTHRRAGPLDLGGFFGLNIGSDYGSPRAYEFDTASRLLREL